MIGHSLDDIVQDNLAVWEYKQDTTQKYICHITLTDFDQNDWNDVISNELIFPEKAVQNVINKIIRKKQDTMVRAIMRKNNFSYSEGQVLQSVQKHLKFTYSLDTILDTVLPVDIEIDTGDSNWDFTANTVPPAHYADHSILESPQASILWLSKQQGHKLGELIHALRNIEDHASCISSPFLYSLAKEVYELQTVMSHLFFFIELPLRQILYLNALINWRRQYKKWGGYIVLNSNVSAGLYSISVGGGSAFGIQFEKDVKIPIKYISHFYPDASLPFGAQDYFANDNFYRTGKISHACIPKQFRQFLKNKKQIDNTEVS